MGLQIELEPISDTKDQFRHVTSGIHALDYWLQ